MLASCYRGALGVIIVFDVTNMVIIIIIVIVIIIDFDVTNMVIIVIIVIVIIIIIVFDVTNMVRAKTIAMKNFLPDEISKYTRYIISS